MGATAESLKGLMNSEDCYDIPWKELLPRQIEAADELFQERVGQIKLLAHRAEDTDVRAVRDRENIVPLLFAHTSYKNYPEAWFVEGKWDRMGQWLNTLMPLRAPRYDANAIADLDGWIEHVAGAGVFLSCSSGTTGKVSMLPSVQSDLDFTGRQMLHAMAWGLQIEPARQFKGFGLTPLPGNARTVAANKELMAAFFSSFRHFPGEPITPGQVSKMIALRRSIADGAAKPADIAAFEALSKQREMAIDEGLQSTAKAIIEARHEPIFVKGMPATAWRISQIVRDMGYSARDFRPDNVLSLAGGAKGALMPADGRQQVAETFNVRPERAYQYYGMQDISTVMPRCRFGRYHVAPWLILLVLDDGGERLIEPSATGEVEGRAAFMDLALEGRWAGVISGDKITADFGRCACGHQGPTVGDPIVRYSELPGGDRITCAGTLDAYVRGVG